MAGFAGFQVSGRLIGVGTFGKDGKQHVSAALLIGDESDPRSLSVFLVTAFDSEYETELEKVGRAKLRGLKIGDVVTVNVVPGKDKEGAEVWRFRGVVGQ